MALRSLVQLLSDLNAIVTSQTAPDAITPTTIDDLFENIIESCWNKVDGITVNNLTDPFVGGIANGDQLDVVIQKLMNSINSISTGTMNPNLFRASKTTPQFLFISFNGSRKLIFEDDTTTPNYDNSNLFYGDAFVPKGAGTFNFAIEEIKVELESGSINAGDTMRVRLLHNGTEIATTLTETGFGSNYDTYNGTVSTGGFVFPVLVKTGVVAAANDIFTVELVKTNGGGTAVYKITEGVFSNTQ